MYLCVTMYNNSVYHIHISTYINIHHKRIINGAEYENM